MQVLPACQAPTPTTWERLVTQPRGPQAHAVLQVALRWHHKHRHLRRGLHHIGFVRDTCAQPRSFPAVATELRRTLRQAVLPGTTVAQCPRGVCDKPLWAL